jgi:hypothetical protein
MRRRGIALLTTVGLVMILSLIILKSVDIAAKYFERANEAAMMTQMDKTFMDLLAILSSTSGEIKDAYGMQAVVGLPIVMGADDMGVAIDIRSAGGVYNINSLIQNGTINESFYDFLLQVLNEYRVPNGQFFMAMLLDSIDADGDERMYRSEARLYNARFRDGGIPSREALRFLLDYFAQNGGSGAIYEVPWEEIVGFYGDGVDYNYMSPTLFDLIKRVYNLPSLSQEEMLPSYDMLLLVQSDKDKLKAAGVNFFAPRLWINMQLSFQGGGKSMRFLYDVNTKKVGYIETVF